MSWPSDTTGDAVGVFSRGILRLPFLSAFLERPVVPLERDQGSDWIRSGQGTAVSAIAGWGRRPTARHAIAFARQQGLPYLALEDGFLRSFGTGEHFPPLSLVEDNLGIYYDSTRPSALESLLASAADVLADIAGDVARARALVLEHRLSKYNHAPALNVALLRHGDARRVLVIDQTAGDMSVTLGAASADTFAAMLAAARADNPHATVYVKSHPEVASGRKLGYLSDVQDDARTVMLRHPINPISLIEQMDRVYVVTSIMGFEAVLAGKPVTVFGLPWYAGWGLTDDRQHCPRRTRTRSADELFAAAYFHYTRYLDPVTHRRGTLFDVIDWLVRQRDMTASYFGGEETPSSRRLICVGFRRWKAVNVMPLLALEASRVRFTPDAGATRTLAPQPADWLVHWGCKAPAGVARLADEGGVPMLRMEDGFVRSVGLGSDLIRPLSLVLDRRGIYFDATQPSDLEHLLNTAQFSDPELERAQNVRAFIVAHGITKYNLDPLERAVWSSGGKQVVLVPGQVEDDASLRYGACAIDTNSGLLQAARRAHPEAWIVYKPHPDVMSGNRAGKLSADRAGEWADHVETRLSVISCIEASDVVHTMTSLAGFDALLRLKPVVVYGQPFYAGWGLTTDVLKEGVAFARRPRRLLLDELVAGTLLRYPLYWDWDLKGYGSCEAVLHRIVETRGALSVNGDLHKLRVGFFRRQWRKVHSLTRAMGRP